MALIYFYDSTTLDEKQLSEGIDQSDHSCIFVREHITLENLDPETEVISVFVSSTVTIEMLQRLPKLKLIACRSTGYNNIPLAATVSHGVDVVNVPSYGENTVAEYTFGLLLALTRKLVVSIQEPETAPEMLMGVDLYGKTLGIIGTGRIGQKVIEIANGFSMKVIAYDVFPRAELAAELGFSYVELKDVFEQSDVVSLHAPYLPSTHHIVDRGQMKSMKKSAVIINTARGELVDTRALCDALHSGEIAGAALDVVEGESLLHLDESILRQEKDGHSDTSQYAAELLELKHLPNVILTPHNAFNTDGAIGRINLATIQNIKDFYIGKLPNKVVASVTEKDKVLLES